MAGRATSKVEPEMAEDKANSRQVGGTHYKKMVLEHWDLVAIFGWDYFQGQISRYMMRWKAKDGLKDLQKMVHVAQKYLEIETLRVEGKLTWSLLRETMTKLEREMAMDDAQRFESRTGADTVLPLPPTREGQ
jgi:hypothetical protein